MPSHIPNFPIMESAETPISSYCDPSLYHRPFSREVIKTKTKTSGYQDDCFSIFLPKFSTKSLSPSNSDLILLILQEQ